MALKATIAASVVLATDTAGDNTVGSRSLSQVVSTWERAQTQTLSVAAEETLQVNLGSLATGKFLLVEAEAAVDVRTNAVDADPQRVAPALAGSPGFLMKTGDFTALWITNPDDSTAVAVTVTVAGLE